jgi:hypothetical protein
MLASISTSVRSADRAATAVPAPRGGMDGTSPSGGSISLGCPVSARSSISAPGTVYSLTT